MNKRAQIKKKRKTYAWSYSQLNKKWKGKVLTQKGIVFVLKVLRMGRKSRA